MALGCALAIVIAVLIAPIRPAKATGFPVIDLSAIAESITQFLEEGKRWAETATQYGKELDYFKSTLSKYQSILDDINTAAMSLQGISGVLKPVDEKKYMVAERCRTALSLGDLASSLIGSLPSLNLDGTEDLDMNAIKKQQVNICIAMQQTRNKRYNASLKFVSESLPKMQEAMNDLRERRNGSSDPGAQADDSTDASMLGSQLEQQMRDYQANMAAYDGYLASLQNNQVALAEIALKGPGTSVLGTMVRTTALMEALGVDAGDIVP